MPRQRVGKLVRVTGLAGRDQPSGERTVFIELACSVIFDSGDNLAFRLKLLLRLFYRLLACRLVLGRPGLKLLGQRGGFLGLVLGARIEFVLLPGGLGLASRGLLDFGGVGLLKGERALLRLLQIGGCCLTLLATGLNPRVVTLELLLTRGQARGLFGHLDAHLLEGLGDL